jgi:protein disulfide-isomerase
MIRKIILTIFVLTLSLAACAREKSDSLNWLENLEEAQLLSEQTDKPIFVNFTGSDWCGWCIKLHDEVFSQKEFIDYASENLILLKLDFPRNIPQTDEIKAYNRDLAIKYEVQGFPTILLLDKNADEINRTGFQYGGAEKYVAHIKELLGK